MNKFLDNAVIYQIYPISFYDSNGDGYGDFNGITQKLDYIKDLGANIIWLNPIYMSPFMDGGYDVTDYEKVNPIFGTEDDLKALLNKAHSLGIKVISDFVPGHTSYKHEWFKNSQKIEKNEYSDYYIWSDSCFHSAGNCLKGISERDGCVTINYYSFQVALNYGFDKVINPWEMKYTDNRLKPLRNKIIEILQKWIEFGFDGFRIDLACSVIKRLQSSKPLVWFWGKIFSAVKKVKSDTIFLAECGNPLMSVGEIGFDIDYLLHDYSYYTDILRREKGSNIYPEQDDGHSYFNEKGLGNIKDFLEKTEEIYTKIDNIGYYSLPSGYHDVQRISMNRDSDQLKVFFAFMFTYKCIPQIYYGDEIGLRYNPNISKDGGYTRTGSRTPMQWNKSKNRGFSVNDIVYLPTDDCLYNDVEYQRADEKSLLSYVKKLSILHNKFSCLHFSGKINVMENGYPLIFERFNNESRIVIMINPSNVPYKRVCVFSEILLQSNCEVENDTIKLNRESFIILKK